MTDTTAPTLRDLVFATDSAPVIDELAEADPSALEYMVDIGNALALLAHAGEIAMLLLPPGSPEDHFAKAMLTKERGEQYRSGGGVHDPKLMERALRRSFADSHPRLIIGARIPPGMEEASRRFGGAVLPQPMAGGGTAPDVYHLEHGLALEAWFDHPPDLATLLDEARTLFASVEAWLQAEPPSPFWFGARRGALILAYARLCRIGLWPARSSDDLIMKMEVEWLISERAADPDPMRAAVEIALGVGRRIARQSERFVTVLGGVEL